MTFPLYLDFKDYHEIISQELTPKTHGLKECLVGLTSCVPTFKAEHHSTTCTYKKGKHTGTSWGLNHLALHTEIVGDF